MIQIKVTDSFHTTEVLNTIDGMSVVSVAGWLVDEAGALLVYFPR